MFTPSPITLPRGGIFAIPVNIATPPPPVLFSAMMFQPVWSFITLARTRPIVSVDPPAPNPICSVITPSGFQPAFTCGDRTRHIAARTIPSTRFPDVPFPRTGEIRSWLCFSIHAVAEPCHDIDTQTGWRRSSSAFQRKHKHWNISQRATCQQPNELLANHARPTMPSLKCEKSHQLGIFMTDQEPSTSERGCHPE